MLCLDVPVDAAPSFLGDVPFFGSFPMRAADVAGGPLRVMSPLGKETV